MVAPERRLTWTSNLRQNFREVLFSRFLHGSRGAALAGWKVEEVGWQLTEIGEDFGRRDDVGVLGVHVAQASTHKLTALLASLRSKQPSSGRITR